MPMTRQPLILAIWPATAPTAPAAPESDDGLARLGLTDIQQAEIRRQSGHAERAQVTGSGAALTSTFMTPSPFEMAYSCTPKAPVTVSPTAKPGFLDAITRPAPRARMTAPISTGAMYDRPSFIQPRIAGSSEMRQHLDQDFAFARLSDRLFGVGPVAPLGHADRAGRQAKLMVDEVHGVRLHGKRGRGSEAAPTSRIRD